MSRHHPILLAGFVLLLTTAHARGSFLLTFEGLKNGEEVLNFYNGGTGNMGSGPGTNYGISFNSTALALIKSFPGDSSPTVMLQTDGNPNDKGLPVTTVMDVSGGFTSGLAFLYLAIDVGTPPPTVTVYSGLDGTGTALGSLALSNTSSFQFADIPFSGTALSAVFRGFDQQEAFDSIQSPLVAEPASSSLLVLGIAGWAIALGARRSRKPSHAQVLPQRVHLRPQRGERLRLESAEST